MSASLFNFVKINCKSFKALAAAVFLFRSSWHDIKSTTCSPCLEIFVPGVEDDTAPAPKPKDRFEHLFKQLASCIFCKDSLVFLEWKIMKNPSAQQSSGQKCSWVALKSDEIWARRKVTTRHVAEDAALIGHQLLSPMPHIPGPKSFLKHSSMQTWKNSNSISTYLQAHECMMYSCDLFSFHSLLQSGLQMLPVQKHEDQKCWRHLGTNCQPHPEGHQAARHGQLAGGCAKLLLQRHRRIQKKTSHRCNAAVISSCHRKHRSISSLITLRSNADCASCLNTAEINRRELESN